MKWAENPEREAAHAAASEDDYATAYKMVELMCQWGGRQVNGGIVSYIWNGWALREAYLRGLLDGREEKTR